MDYITTKEAAIKWGISDRRVLQYCNDNRIDRAVKMSNVWLIPKDAKKPADGRFKNGDVWFWRYYGSYTRTKGV